MLYTIQNGIARNIHILTDRWTERNSSPSIRSTMVSCRSNGILGLRDGETDAVSECNSSDKMGKCHVKVTKYHASRR